MTGDEQRAATITDTTETNEADELEAAHDFRAQQQARFGANDISPLKQLSEHFDEALAFIRQQFPGIELPGLETELRTTFARAVGVHEEPISHMSMESACKEVEKAAEALGLPLHSGVSYGVLHGDGLEAMQQSLMMTQASVILMTAHLQTAIHRLAKLVARSVVISGEEDTKNVGWSLEQIKTKLFADSQLQKDWSFFLMDYSLNPYAPNKGRAIEISDPNQMMLMGDFSESMNWFVIAHEYGHHIMRHSLDGELGADGEDTMIAQRKEVEADSIAAHICLLLGQNNERGQNYPAHFNLGSVLVLSVLDYFKRGRKLMLTGTEENYRTDGVHPPLAERLNTVAKVTREHYSNERGEEDKSLARILEHQRMASELIAFIWEISKDWMLREFKVDGVRGVPHTPSF